MVMGARHLGHLTSGIFFLSSLRIGSTHYIPSPATRGRRLTHLAGSGNVERLATGESPMRKLLLVLFVGGLAVSLMQATPAPKNAKKPVLYFPTEVGTRWVFDSGGSITTKVITKVEENDSVVLVSVASEGKDGKAKAGEQVEVSKDGFRFVYPNGRKDTILKLPLHVGEEWTYDRTRLDGTLFELVRLRAFGPEKVTVPAGAFEAIRVETERSMSGLAGEVEAVNIDCPTETFWYAPNVGMVKYTNSKHHGDYVLKSFTPGKD
jgi:hypothetical protein